MKVLVAAASKHGSTTGIADRIGKRIGQAGLDVDITALTDGPDPAGYDAVVLGSGVYYGTWLKSGRRYVDRNSETLAAMPVWLFSSGPLGDQGDQSDDSPVKAETIVAATAAEDHVVLFGSLHRSDLGFGERAIMKKVGAPEGDFREWETIDAWADTIVERLTDSASG